MTAASACGPLGAASNAGSNRAREHSVRGVQRKLQGDVPAGGVADDMRPFDIKAPHERPAVRGLLRDADRTRQTTAARIADAVVAERAVMLGKRSLFQQWLEPVREDARMYEYDPFPTSPYFVLKFDAFEGCPVHARSFHKQRSSYPLFGLGPGIGPSRTRLFMQEPGAKRLTVREKISTYVDESVPRAVASEAPSNKSNA